MSTSWLFAGIVAAAWLLVTLLQLGDVATAFLDSRTARDRDIPGRIARERLNELFWIIPLAAVVALGIGLGIDHAGHYFFDDDQPSVGSLVLLGLAVLVVGVLTLALGAVAATDRVSYSALRRELREVRADLRERDHLPPKVLGDLHARLVQIDHRTRSRQHTGRLLLRTTSLVRLASVVVGVLLIVAVSIAVARAPHERDGALIVFSVFAPIVSAALAALGIRFGLTSELAWRRVYAKQRADILKLLEEFDRSSRKRVAGLRERVSNALRILNQQNGPEQPRD